MGQTRLLPSGKELTVGILRLRTPRLAGTVEVFEANGGSSNFRGSGPQTFKPALERALTRQKIAWSRQLVISGAHSTDSQGREVAYRGAPEPAIHLEALSPGEKLGQFVFTIDEAGLAHFSFPDPATKGKIRLQYAIPSHVPPAPKPRVVKTRGIAHTVGKKIIQVLVFPLFEPLLGEVGVGLASAFERHRFPYGIRTFTPTNYQEPSTSNLTAEDWARLGKGPALLLVHGTFSRSHRAFAGLSETTMKELHRHYGGRVFAFDHYTLSEDPVQNVEHFLSQMPEGTKLDLDILCHSRGGLVSRVFAEKQTELALGSRQINVHRIVFVGVPNGGTVLTDSEYMGEFISSYTNLLNFFPDNGITETLEGILTVAKMLAVGAVGGLKGLQAMQPNGPFLKQLNAGAKSSTGYFALASEFAAVAPGVAGIKDWAEDHLMDKVFQGVANDLVVPTDGVFSVEGNTNFPIEERFVFPKERGICHTTFFSTTEGQARILDWLSGPSALELRHLAAHEVAVA